VEIGRFNPFNSGKGIVVNTDVVSFLFLKYSWVMGKHFPNIEKMGLTFGFLATLSGKVVSEFC